MLREKDSILFSRLIRLWARHIRDVGWLPVGVRYPDWYQNQAACRNDEAAIGFMFLGTNAQPAVPALIKIYEQNISPRSQVAASRALIAIWPAAPTAIPSFLRRVASTNETIRSVAVMALMQVDPELVVPALATSLSGTNMVARLLAARGLQHFVTNAQLVVPALVLLLSDPSERVRFDAANALKAIDPKAAAKAGVK